MRSKQKPHDLANRLGVSVAKGDANSDVVEKITAAGWTRESAMKHCGIDEAAASHWPCLDQLPGAKSKGK